MKTYPNFTTRLISSPDALNNLVDTNPSCANVLRAFSRLGPTGSYLAVWDGDLIPDLRYTANLINRFGIENHFQGVQRLRSGRHIVVSGGDPHEPASHLFVFKLASRPTNGSWDSNILTAELPPEGDRLIQIVTIDTEKWHAGGMSALGDILAIPVYSKNPDACQIVFYDMSNPEDPARFDVTIDRPDQRAGAVAMTKLANGRYLVGVWSDSDSQARRLDFYVSNSQNLLDGFGNQVTWTANAAISRNGQETNFENYQTVNFINQADGQLYLVGLHNTSDRAPTFSGKDYADLWRIHFRDADFGLQTNGAINPSVIKMSKLQFNDTGRQSNMDAAAGVYVGQDRGLHIYSTYHWRSDGVLNFVEYKEMPPKTSPSINALADGWIDMFEHDNFGGKRMSLSANGENALADYRRVTIAGHDFGDRISSARFQLPDGQIYRLFEHDHYRGQHLDLTGTGEVVELADFDMHDFDNKVPSSRLIMT